MSATDSDIESYKSTLTEDHYLGARATQIHTRARGAPTCTLARRRRPVARRARTAGRGRARARVCARRTARLTRDAAALCFSHSLYSVHTLLAPFSSEFPTPTISYPRLSNLAIRNKHSETDLQRHLAVVDREWHHGTASPHPPRPAPRPPPPKPTPPLSPCSQSRVAPLPSWWCSHQPPSHLSPTGEQTRAQSALIARSAALRLRCRCCRSHRSRSRCTRWRCSGSRGGGSSGRTSSRRESCPWRSR